MGILLFIIYNLLTPFMAAAYFGCFIFSPRRGRLRNFLSELGERLAVAGVPMPEGAVWIHAASMGEVGAVKKLALTLKEKYPGVPLFITTSSGSGRREALKLTEHARLLPLDFYPLMKGFVGKVKPRLLLIAETELWPNLLVCAAAAGTRICVINGRISPKTLRLYRLVAPLTRRMFSGVTKVFAQSPADAAGYALLMRDASKVAVTGNMKYDAVDAAPDRLDAVNAVLEKIGWTGKAVWTAASTHRGEEEAVLDCFLALKEADPGLKLVIAPRHSERAGETRELLASKNIAFMAWSERNNNPSVPHPSSLIPHPSAPDCLLIDETGWLMSFFSLSAAAFVGGTLVDIGGHNLLEPAAFSKPVLFGPYVRSTREAADALLKTRGGFMAADGAELRARLSVLLKDANFLKNSGANAKKALETLQGATAATFASVEQWLK